MGDIVADHLCLLQSLLKLRRTHRRSDVPAHAAITEETSLPIKQGLTARRNVDFGTVHAGGSVPEVTKWPVRIEVRYVKAPLLRLLLEVASILPAQRADRSDGQGADSVELMLGYSDVTVVRPGLPVPIGSRLGKIAEALLALAKRIFGPLLVFDFAIDAVPFHDVSELVAQWLGTAQEPAVLPVRAADAFYVFIGRPSSHGSAPSICHFCAFLRMKYFGPF